MGPSRLTADFAMAIWMRGSWTVDLTLPECLSIGSTPICRRCKIVSSGKGCATTCNHPDLNGVCSPPPPPPWGVHATPACAAVTIIQIGDLRLSTNASGLPNILVNVRDILNSAKRSDAHSLRDMICTRNQPKMSMTLFSPWPNALEEH